MVAISLCENSRADISRLATIPGQAGRKAQHRAREAGDVDLREAAREVVGIYVLNADLIGGL